LSKSPTEQIALGFGGCHRGFSKGKRGFGFIDSTHTACFGAEHYLRALDSDLRGVDLRLSLQTTAVGCGLKIGKTQDFVQGSAKHGGNSLALCSKRRDDFAREKTHSWNSALLDGDDLQAKSLLGCGLEREDDQITFLRDGGGRGASGIGSVQAKGDEKEKDESFHKSAEGRLHGVFKGTSGSLGFEVRGHERDLGGAGFELATCEFER
jgi:hypothetical protein